QLVLFMLADRPRSRRTREHKGLSLRRLGLIILALGILFVMLGGLALLIGKAHPHEPLYRLIGAGMLTAAIALLALTARTWAPWFSPLCFLAALKALFAGIFGFTLSAPTLATSRPYMFEFFLLLAGIVTLTFRFIVK